MVRRILCVCAISMSLTTGEVSAGGGVSKCLLGIGAGILTGGLSYAFTGALATSALSGGAAAIAASTGGKVKAGVKLNPKNGKVMGAKVDVSLKNGQKILKQEFSGSKEKGRAEKKFSGDFYENIKTAEGREYEAEKSYDVKEGKEECKFELRSSGGNYWSEVRREDWRLMVTNSNRWALGGGCKTYAEAERRGIEDFSDRLESESEREASRYYVMESTRLLWRFEKVWCLGEMYYRAYVPAMEERYDLYMPSSSKNRLWVGAGNNYRKKEERGRGKGSSHARSESPKPVETSFRKAQKTASKIYDDCKKYVSDLLPSELKECGSLVFEYVNKNTPNVVKDVLSCSLGTLVSGLETLDTEISYTGDSVRRILRKEFGVNQCLAQDLGDVVKLGGSLAVSLLPGKLINSAVEGVKLMKLSAAGGPGGGFKFVLEDPKPKYRSLNLKDNGGISGSNGSGFKKTAQKTERIKTRVASTKIDLDRYVDGFLENKGALLNRGKTLDGHQYYEVMKKTEYMGETFKKGDYISLDTLHYEVEWFSNPKTHKGAINVLTGEKYKDGIPGRVLKIK